MSSMTKPTVMVLRRRMFWARESGWKPSDWIAARTLPRVPGRTVSGALRLRETVPTDTPETRATSRMVAGFSLAIDKALFPCRRFERLARSGEDYQAIALTAVKFNAGEPLSAEKCRFGRRRSGPVFCNHRLVHLDAEAGTLGHLIITVVELRSIGDQRIEHGVAVAMECFEIRAVRYTRQKMRRNLRFLM